MKSLHKLIQHLSQNEKRYIKLRLNANKTESELVHYFDAFTKQQEYNIKDLQKTFGKSAKLLRANFGKLYAAILKNLRLFHDNCSPEYIMQGMLSDIQLLLNKGMIAEAKKSNEKLIGIAKEKESYYILVKACAQESMLHHLSGTLSYEKSLLLEKKMDDYTSKHIEIELLTGLYRKALVIYNEYFFGNKSDKAAGKTFIIINHPLLIDMDGLSTDQSKMIFCEIWSIHYVIHSGQEKHYEIRKKQYELIFSSSVYKEDYTNKILITGNLCAYWVHSGDIKKLQEQFLSFKKYFGPIIENSTDDILIEKYYDVYLQCKICILKYSYDDDEITGLIKEVNEIVYNKIYMNPKLIGRTLWSMAELLILHNHLKEALKWIINFQDVYKKSGKSHFYIESEIGLLIIYWSMHKYDEFEKKIIQLNKKINTGEYELGNEQQIIFDVLKELLKFDKSNQQIEAYTKKISGNTLYKTFLFSISNNTNVNSARKYLYLKN